MTFPYCQTVHLGSAVLKEGQKQGLGLGWALGWSPGGEDQS